MEYPKANCLFISCDIIGHSKEAEKTQLERVLALNEMVKNLIALAPNDFVWASGGDGGHLACTNPTWKLQALELIGQLKKWALQSQVPLRMSGTYGTVYSIIAADGRAQLIGAGINLAGKLLAHSNENRIIATQTFIDQFKNENLENIFFHDQQAITLPHFPKQMVALLSIKDEFQSKW